VEDDRADDPDPARFEHVINDLGGVRICLPYPISDPRSKLHLSRGIHHVMGAQALAYWRVRYIGVGSDLERIQRDQYLMASVAQEVKHTNLLGDPSRVLRLVSDIAGSLTTDSGLSQSAMITLVQSLRHLPLRAVHFVEVPVVTYPPNPNWVQWSGQAATLFRAIAQDRKLPRVHRRRHSRRAQPPSSSASPAASRPASPSPLSGLSSHYGGITAGANVCGDSSAFQGPLGGH
jgi:anionic cell wall polymer biosynthesis LytR-Cps2A-Psr (LCP) family protein